MVEMHKTIPKKTQFRTSEKDNILLFVPDIRFYDDKIVSFKAVPEDWWPYRIQDHAGARYIV